MQRVNIARRKARWTRADYFNLRTDIDAYEIMRPEDVGLHESRVVLTARTGRAGLRDRLEKLGFALSPEELDQAYARFLSIADKKQEVFDEDLTTILHEELQATSEDWRLEHLHVSGGCE